MNLKYLKLLVRLKQQATKQTSYAQIKMYIYIYFAPGDISPYTSTFTTVYILIIHHLARVSGIHCSHVYMYACTHIVLSNCKKSSRE